MRTVSRAQELRLQIHEPLNAVLVVQMQIYALHEETQRSVDEER